MLLEALEPRLLLSGTISDPGFELPVVGSGVSAYQYNPSSSPWTFTGQAGVAGPASGFTSDNAPAPQGAQVAFLQEQGSVSQSFTLAAGTYALAFQAAQRGSGNNGGQDFSVLMDGQSIAQFMPDGTNYSTFTTNPFTVTGAFQFTDNFKGVPGQQGIIFDDQYNQQNNNNIGQTSDDGAAVTPLQLTGLTVTDAGNSANSATASAPEPNPVPTLYVTEDASTGTATVDLSASVSASTDNALSKVGWSVTGNDASPTSGTFAGSTNPSVTLTPTAGNYEFVVTAGQSPLTVLSVNVIIVTGQLNVIESNGTTVLPHQQAATTGGCVVVNNDNDNGSLTPGPTTDGAVTYVTAAPDNTYVGAISSEKDLAPIKITGSGTQLFQLKYNLGGANDLKLWNHANRTDPILSGGFVTLVGGSATVYAEGLQTSAAQGADKIELFPVLNGVANATLLDTISETVYQFTGPQYVPDNSQYAYSVNLPGFNANTSTVQWGVTAVDGYKNVIGALGNPNGNVLQQTVTWSNQGPSINAVTFSPAPGFENQWYVYVVHVAI
jgi:hypothetical protein